MAPANSLLTHKKRNGISDLERIENLFIPEPNSGCWLWLGALTEHGYGRATVRDKKILAHRWVYQATTGEPIGDKCLCHRCDTPACVNPDHMFVGTPLDNTRDAARKGRLHRWRNTRAGEGNPAAVLTEQMVREMREVRSGTGASYAVIARRFGVSWRGAHAAIRGETWGHIK
jgi:hypothetical protein